MVRAPALHAGGSWFEPGCAHFTMNERAVHGISPVSVACINWTLNVIYDTVHPASISHTKEVSMTEPTIHTDPVGPVSQSGRARRAYSGQPSNPTGCPPLLERPSGSWASSPPRTSTSAWPSSCSSRTMRFRARLHSEYWWTVLFNFIIFVAIQALMPSSRRRSHVGHTRTPRPNSPPSASSSRCCPLLGYSLLLFLAWPSVRRLPRRQPLGMVVSADSLRHRVTDRDDSHLYPPPQMTETIYGPTDDHIVLFVAIFVVSIISLIFVISDSHPEAWRQGASAVTE